MIGFGIWVGHIIVAIGCLVVAMNDSMRRFDNPAWPRSVLADLCAALVDVFFFPLNMVPRSITTGWSAFALNSALWAIVLTISLRLLSRLHRSR